MVCFRARKKRPSNIDIVEKFRGFKYSVILIDKGYGDRIGTGLFYRKLANKKEGFYALFFISF